MAADFVYKPLDLSQPCIRLVDVLPLEADGKIRCRIYHYTLGSTSNCSPLAYNALSYEWGISDMPHIEIELNGQRFWVRQNLYHFFICRLKSQDNAAITRLWVDALCINQSDVSERNHQVQQMKSIFNTADQVYLWLGMAQDGSDAFFDWLNSLRPQWDAADFNGFGRKPVPDAVILNKVIQADPAVFDAFKWLCKRTYWFRVWIISEILLAKYVLLSCGLRTIPWSAWAMAVKAFKKRDDEEKDNMFFLIGLNPLLEIVRLWFDPRPQPRYDLTALVHRFRFAQCQKVHDRAYGLLGLATNASQFRVQYGQPCELLILQLLSEASTACSLEDIRILCQAFLRRPTDVVEFVLPSPESTDWRLSSPSYATPFDPHAKSAIHISAAEDLAFQSTSMNICRLVRKPLTPLSWCHQVCGIDKATEADIVLDKCRCALCNSTVSLANKSALVAFHNLRSVGADIEVWECVEGRAANFYAPSGPQTEKLVYCGTAVLKDCSKKRRDLVYKRVSLVYWDQSFLREVNPYPGQQMTNWQLLNLLIHEAVETRASRLGAQGSKGGWRDSRRLHITSAMTQ